MAGRDWSEVVEEAVRRHVDTTGSSEFTRQELIDAELDRIVSETGSQGATPHMTLSRELQQLRDQGIIEFVDDRGNYKLVG
jgi:putative restriction endonuclease